VPLAALRRSRRATRGLHLADQMIYRGGGANPPSLTPFARPSWRQCGDQQHADSWTAACLRGLIPGRSNDVAGFAVSYGSFSSDSASPAPRSPGRWPPRSTELVSEWSYSIQVARWLAVQPDVQYIVKPGGSSAIPNALVGAFRSP
jgi:porin